MAQPDFYRWNSCEVFRVTPRPADEQYGELWKNVGSWTAMGARCAHLISFVTCCHLTKTLIRSSNTFLRRAIGFYVVIRGRLVTGRLVAMTYSTAMTTPI